jgi:hypothetical protein
MIRIRILQMMPRTKRNCGKSDVFHSTLWPRAFVSAASLTVDPQRRSRRVPIPAFVPDLAQGAYGGLPTGALRFAGQPSVTAHSGVRRPHFSQLFEHNSKVYMRCQAAYLGRLHL